MWKRKLSRLEKWKKKSQLPSERNTTHIFIMFLVSDHEMSKQNILMR